MSAARIVHDEPYCRIVLRDSPRTMVVFAAVNYPAGKFAATRTLQNADCNVVYLNCPHNSWYLEGVPGLGTCPKSSARALRELLEANGLIHDRRVVWGSSMGGYGAVLYGALMGADVIVASGPVLRLFQPGNLSETYLHLSGKREDLRQLDVREKVAAAPGRFFLYAGEAYYPDLACSRTIMDLPNVTLTTLADFGHWLPNYFDERFGLERFVLTHLDQGRVYPFEDGEVGTLKNWSDHWDLLDQGALEWKDPEHTLLLEQERDSKDPVWKSHCRIALSMGATKSGFHKRAIVQAEKAVKILPDSRYARRRLVLALRKSGGPPEKWLKHAMRIRDINRPHVFDPAEKLLESMAGAFAACGRVNRGVKFLHSLMEMENTLPKVREWLGKLAESLAHCRTWKVAYTAEAREELLVHNLREPVLHVLGGRSSIEGAMLFPGGWGSVTFEAEGLVIERCRSNVPSPAIAKKYPNRPQAAKARFNIEFTTQDVDVATLHAIGRDGRRMAVIQLTRMPKKGGGFQL